MHVHGFNYYEYFIIKVLYFIIINMTLTVIIVITTYTYAPVQGNSLYITQNKSKPTQEGH